MLWQAALLSRFFGWILWTFRNGGLHDFYGFCSAPWSAPCPCALGADEPFAALVALRLWFFLFGRYLGSGAFSRSQGRLLRVPVRILWPLSTDPKPAAGGHNGIRRFFPGSSILPRGRCALKKAAAWPFSAALRPWGAAAGWMAGFGRAVRKAAMNAASHTQHGDLP
jgi:hypothetical protein